MAQDVTLRQLISRSSRNATPVKKFVSSVSDWLSQREVSGQPAEDEVATAMLRQLLSTPTPPANLLGYLSQLFSSGLVTSFTLLTHLLFLVSDGEAPSRPLLVSLSTFILTYIPQPPQPLPTTLTRPSSFSPIPDIGTSASASPPPSGPVSTLGLLLPLLRLCTTSSEPPTPTPIIAMLNRILGLLPPYPAPPLDIGLEAGSLFQTLPETLSVPLRDCLSGLMADLSVSQDTAQLQLNDVVPAINANPQGMPILPPMVPGQVQPGLVQQGQMVQNGLAPVPSDGMQGTQGVPGTNTMPIPSLPTFISQVPLQYSMALQLSWMIRSNRRTTSDPTMQEPPENHTSLIRLGPHIASDPSTFLQYLLRISLAQTNQVREEEKVARWLFVTERLPVLLKWWKDSSSMEWPYPDNLTEALSTVFEAEKDDLVACNAWISTTLQTLAQQAENEDESGGFSQPEGWMLCTQQVTLIQRLMEIGLLQKSDASSILPGMSIPPTTPGESLINRIASAPKAHLRALSHIIAFAPGAARSLAKDVFEVVQAAPTTQPLDGLFVNLAHEPRLLCALGGYINPATWLQAIRSQLLEYPDDPATRRENPQDTKSRYGEGAIFAEGFIAHFDLPLPPILQDARRAVSFAELDEAKRNCVNGWIKALFGSEGIDDDIILATSPSEFYRLAPGTIHQAVLATAYGQLDHETLQGGLSYFAQPLLSWSLTGITAWLADEIMRNGLISGPYLTVLQAFVMSSSFPDSILRVTGRKIADLLEPSAGLAAVLQSSSFDVSGVKQKLANVNVMPSPTISAGEALRLDLQMLKALELAPPTWSSALCASIERSTSILGSAATFDIISAELREGTTVYLPQDSFAHLLSLLIAQQPSSTSSPFLQRFSSFTLSDLFRSPSSALADPAKATQATIAISRTIKQSLLIAARLDTALADKTASSIMDELTYHQSRPIKRKIEDERTVKKRMKKDEIEVEVKMALEAIGGALKGDEELKSRWSRFGDLSNSPV